MRHIPLYLFSAWLGRPNRDIVHVNIRLSGAAEETAQTNQIPLDKFKEILVETFKFAPHAVDREIAEMQLGRGYSRTLSMTKDGLARTGLLTRDQVG
jgi:hypothetical protein